MKRIIFSNPIKFKGINKINNFVNRNKCLCLLTLTFIVGMIIGSFSAKDADESILSRFDCLFNSNLSVKANQSVLENFIMSFSAHFIFIMASFLMGLSVWGFLAVPFIVAFFGFEIGLSGGYLCARYGIIGFSFNSFVLLPGILLSSIALLLISRESINFSVAMASRILKIKFLMRFDKLTSIKIFFARAGIVLILTLGASLLDILLTVAFSGFFNFSELPA